LRSAYPIVYLVVLAVVMRNILHVAETRAAV
jgi:hypothetical protein